MSLKSQNDQRCNVNGVIDAYTAQYIFVQSSTKLFCAPYTHDVLFINFQLHSTKYHRTCMHSLD